MRRIVEEDLRYKSYTIKVRQMLSEARTKWSKEFWPPNSPDLNPLDFYVWGVVERVTNKSRHPNVASLRAAIEAAFTDMDRIKACLRTLQTENGGGHSSKRGIY
ncbi:hypothetical protein ALC56_06315 [Trachymyrmex septentrionalis]|uniref:Tc1-like transposase DDE domain-containing protein n=1 Tax=Trachymyrmex septentrionalis TaxID=34720 RepID=A0A151JX43_9HYME|nr:hypothetical protein ALC56_06315 [Trachymyrmex septentrionalis]